MSSTAPDIQALAHAAQTALRARDWTTARARLQDMVAAGRGDAPVFALLATACQRQGDAAAAHQAADRALILDARNLRGALVKADLLGDQGAKREANFYYNAAIDIADAAPGAVPPDLVEALARVRALRERIAAEMREQLSAELARAGYAEGRSDPRFSHALDLMTGKRRLYAPQPRAFYYPELPARQFYPRAMFPWMDAVEAAVDDMAEELNAVLADQAAFAPYLQTHPDMPSRPDTPLIDSMDWSACFLWKDGAETANAARCPRTMAALADAPLCRVKARSPQVMFSQLKAGAHIQPHTGFVNTRLTCHLPLVVPPGCWFRVGNEVREWEKGKAWAFDDTIEHEAKNPTDRDRVVLIFDIWRPELSEEERGLVATLLETLDAYSPQAATWE